MSIRGNHDDPSYYKKGKFELSNFKLIEDQIILLKNFSLYILKYKSVM